MKRPITYHLARLVRALSLAPRPYTTAVILAGGSGSRMGDERGMAKQWIKIGDRTVLERSVAAFEACPHIDEIVVVVRRGEGESAANVLRAMGTRKVRAVVSGGKTRQHSAYNGARRASEKTRYIAIHDAARPFVSPEDISAVVTAAYMHKAASLGTPVTDTVKRVNRSNFIVETKDRSELWLAATPQVFSYPMYLSAARAALKAGRAVTDDNMLMESLGQRVRMVAAESELLKVTVPRDLARAEALAAAERKENP